MQMLALRAAWVTLFLSVAAGFPGDSSTWDAAFKVDEQSLPGITSAALYNVTMLQMPLYVPSSPLAFLPAAYLAPSTGYTLSMIQCTITTDCLTVEAYKNYMQANSPSSLLATGATSTAQSARLQFLVIDNYNQTTTGLQVVISKLTLQCDQATENAYQAAILSANSSASFQSALAAVSMLNKSVSITIAGNISASYAAGWPASGYSLASGTMHIQGSGILDFKMDSNLIHLASNLVSISNITVLNLCSITAKYGTQLNFTQSIGAQAFNQTWIGAKTLYMTNVTMAVPRYEMSPFAYWMAIYPSIFPKINGYLTSIKTQNADLPPGGYMPNSDTLFFTEYRTLNFMLTNCTLVSQEASEAGMSDLMPPTFCSSSPTDPKKLVPASTLNKSSLIPLYVLTPQTPLAAKLTEIAFRIQSLPPAYYFPFVLMQFSPVSLANLTGSNITFVNDFVWMGPSVPPGTISQGNPGPDIGVDLAGLSGMLRVSGVDSGLFMQRLTLWNLAVASIPGGSKTSLPLWAFAVDRSSAGVIMDSMCIVLPMKDYGHLYALAKAGGLRALANARAANPDWAAIQDAVLDNVTTFTIKSFGTQSIWLSKYAAWGNNGTNMVFMPEGNFTDDQPTPLNPAAAASGTSGDSTASWKIIVAVVVSVGGLLLIAGIIGAAWFIRKKHLAEAAAKKESKGGASDAGVPYIYQYDSDKCNEVQLNCTDDNAPLCGTSMFLSSPLSTVRRDPNMRDSAQYCAPGSQYDSRASNWDPMRQVQELMGMVQGQTGEKLVVMERIGQGGFGTVYRGQWRNLDVAVKTVLFTNKQGTKDAPELRAITEAAVCTSVVHPNVVSTYHYDIKSVETLEVVGSLQIEDDAKVDCTDWKLYLVQELCHASVADGLEAPLFHTKDTKKPIMEIILNIVEDVAAGMEYIHSLNIIHGDLKPENVLMKQDTVTGELICKITDFGLCTTIDPNKSHISGFKNGTPFYMAPEIDSTGKATKTSDVYSFGILILELYKGVPPWVQTDKGFRPNRTFLHRPEHGPPRYWQLALQCMDKNPRKRPEFSAIRAIVEDMSLCLKEGYSLLERLQVGGSAPASLKVPNLHDSQLPPVKEGGAEQQEEAFAVPAGKAPR